MKQEPKHILKDLLILYKKLLIPFMRIRRDIPFPTEPERDETDGEHAFTLAMVALSMHERLNLKLDTGKIAHYALVHDLVETHAGDTSVKAAEAVHATKEKREEEAYRQIKRDFEATFPWLHKTIAAYESRQDAESKFVYALDKSMGALGWLAADGLNWRKYYPEESGSMYHLVLKRLRKKVARDGDQVMIELFDVIHQELENKQDTYYKQS